MRKTYRSPVGTWSTSWLMASGLAGMFTASHTRERLPFAPRLPREHTTSPFPGELKGFLILGVLEARGRIPSPGSCEVLLPIIWVELRPGQWPLLRVNSRLVRPRLSNVGLWDALMQSSPHLQQPDTILT